VKNFLVTSFILIAILNIYVSCGTAAINNDTGIKISNEINRIGDNQYQMSYKIVTPKIIHYDFVLALDSSGSFGETGTQYEAVLRDVPEFLRTIAGKYPDAYFNMSIISWDDNIDFLYDKKNGYVSINKNEPLTAKLAPIDNITKDLEELGVLYKSKQTEGTAFSVPIKASLDIFKTPENSPRDVLHTKRFILMVTGNGEFAPCSDDLLIEASDRGIEIYTVGLDVGNKSELENYLKDISRNKINFTPSPSGSMSNYRYVSSQFGKELNYTIRTALQDHFDKIMNESVALNIEISDQLYCYMKPELNSLSIEIKKDKLIKRSQKVLNGINSNRLTDDTSEVTIKIPELLPNSTTTVTFNIENTFDPMWLPVTVSERKGPLTICSPIERPTMLRYLWRANMLKKELPLDVAKHNAERLIILSAKDTNFNETLKLENPGFVNYLKKLFAFGRNVDGK
jgi:hypothetical protein